MAHPKYDALNDPIPYLVPQWKNGSKRGSVFLPDYPKNLIREAYFGVVKYYLSEFIYKNPNTKSL